MRFFVLLSCLFMPFAMAYFIKNTEVSWYVYLTIPIAFGFPAGHMSTNTPLLLGATYSLTVEKSNSKLELL